MRRFRRRRDRHAHCAATREASAMMRRLLGELLQTAVLPERPTSGILSTSRSENPARSSYLLRPAVEDRAAGGRRDRPAPEVLRRERRDGDRAIVDRNRSITLPELPPTATGEARSGPSGCSFVLVQAEFQGRSRAARSSRSGGAAAFHWLVLLRQRARRDPLSGGHVLEEAGVGRPSPRGSGHGAMTVHAGDARRAMPRSSVRSGASET